MNHQTAKKQRRETLALKWAHLDNLTIPEIQDRFAEKGIEITTTTIRNYLNSKPAEEVIEQIQQKHAKARTQIAEREEEAYGRARKQESEATQTEEIIGMKPRMETNTSDSPIQAPAWEVIEDPEEQPEWAGEEDHIIEFTGGTTEILPGQSYYLSDPDNQPIYEETVVGLKRDEPDVDTQKSLRYEQSEHLEKKGDALGIYEEEISITGSVDVDAEIDVPDEIVQALVTASHSRLESADSEEDSTADRDSNPDGLGR